MYQYGWTFLPLISFRKMSNRFWEIASFIAKCGSRISKWAMLQRPQGWNNHISVLLKIIFFNNVKLFECDGSCHSLFYSILKLLGQKYCIFRTWSRYDVIHTNRCKNMEFYSNNQFRGVRYVNISVWLICTVDIQQSWCRLHIMKTWWFGPLINIYLAKSILYWLIK